MTRKIEPNNTDDVQDYMYESATNLKDAVVGHRIVDAKVIRGGGVITLDNGTQVRLIEEASSCCAYTSLDAFLRHPQSVDHIITGVGTSGGFTTWHIYADMGDVLKLTVSWSAGTGYYGYGFRIKVTPMEDK